MTPSHQIAWTALQEGVAVLAADGEELGHVSRVVGEPGSDIFSGIAFRSGVFDKERFAPAEMVRRITPEAVHLSVPSEESDGLELFER